MPNGEWESSDPNVTLINPAPLPPPLDFRTEHLNQLYGNAVAQCDRLEAQNKSLKDENANLRREKADLLRELGNGYARLHKMANIVEGNE